jgi:23S rRNA pseudouridine1911/1915/1917 synthase
MSSPQDIPEVLYEDNHLLVVNKRVSDIVQGDKTGDMSLDRILKKYISEKYHKPGEAFLGVVHRIDRPVSGVVIFSRTSKSLSRMNQFFKDGKVQKTYWAVVKNLPPETEGSLSHFLVRDPKKNKSFAFGHEVKGSKEALLSYKVIHEFDKYYLLEIDLKTGRHHQIRSQLSKIGCPIKGDLKYGFPRSNPDGGISLHAFKVVFPHPVKDEMISVEALPPSDILWDAYCKKIGLY